MKKEKSKTKKIIIVVLISISSLLVILASTFFIYFSIYSHPDEYALSLETSNEFVDFKKENNKLFYEPKVESNESIIVYTGAKVSYEAYATLGYNLAKLGKNVVICSSPFNFPMFNINEVDNVIGYKPNQTYYVLGHSMGGIALTRYTLNNSTKIKGLILLGSYPDVNISSLEVDVLSIRGSNDQICSKDKIESSKTLLPVNTSYIEIEGGNHAQFGSYGKQNGDGEATISNKEQIEQTSNLIVNWLK